MFLLLVARCLLCIGTNANYISKRPIFGGVVNHLLLERLFVATKVLVASLLLISLSGCTSFFSIQSIKSNVDKFLKPDLHAFLDNDSIPKPEEEEEAVEYVEEEDIEEVSKDEVKQEHTDETTEISKVLQEAPIIEDVIAERCSPDADPKFSYRRRIGLLAFDINNRQDSSDFPHIETQYPELLQGVIDNERFIVKAATQYRLLNKTDSLYGGWVESRRLQVMQLAKELGVQFIITGAAEDMSVVNPRTSALQLFFDKHARNKLMGEVIRHLEMSLSVYDGGTGRLIKRQTFADSVTIDTKNVSERKQLNKTFLKSPYGQLMAKILQQQSDFLLPALDCIPMQMTVLAVSGRDGTVTFDGGIESLVLPGDKLQLYRRIDMDWEGTQKKLYRLERYGVLTVSRSNTFSAEALFDQGNMASGVNPGDIVQAW